MSPRVTLARRPRGFWVASAEGEGGDSRDDNHDGDEAAPKPDATLALTTILIHGEGALSSVMEYAG